MEWVFLGLALLLVVANGFFVATEFAIVKIRATRLQSLVDEGTPGASTALKMVSELDAYLSATQFGITLASLGLGWLGEPAFEHLLHPVVDKVLPEAMAAKYGSTAAGIIGFSIITFLHIVMGELAPKSVAIQRAEQTTLAVALPMRAFYFLFYPAIRLLNWLAGLVLKAFGLHSASESHEATNEDELRVILHSSAQAGAITTARAELLERALEMAQKTARQVMVPRNQMRYLDVEEALDRNVIDARASGHTWLPVCRGNLDEVEGVVNVKDLFFLLSRGELRSLSQVQRPVLFIPENATLEQLLTEFRRRRRQIAMVVDEHGGTSGLVTIADVVAEVVGDVAELGRRVEEVRALPGGRFELPGTAQLDDLEAQLDVTFDLSDDEKGEVTTIAGYLMTKLGRVPEKGDSLKLDMWRILVEEVDGPRVVRVTVEPQSRPTAVPKDGSRPTEPPVPSGETG
ncbi:HlyC/CorC family transporter [Corallococcus exiguus]|uniref:hemolysin family protein n=1 Tax=Corallococcus TaxID=83461 RepID=UPI000ED6381F|nr:MULTISPECIES: hemolysin family protein [Corallococcus]NNB91153.1 HlyC/CorC family transporter [Corallococcus exiguus]NNB99136.1 HlyC/CorC family transporter [Corallococcus exiguus]NNC07098.1 HlyC/CorC family transporter [Corallococcus exiguus]NPC51834.1 HlyC/CorC family transporter [Corallococcus exiguus]RKH75188.1 HlyC/CorC family transporter [Corallococcus sp. AB032C]